MASKKLNIPDFTKAQANPNTKITGTSVIENNIPTIKTTGTVGIDIYTKQER